MKLNLLSTALLSGACYAWPRDLHAWYPPLPTDSKTQRTSDFEHPSVWLTDETGRSPCPGLNALANHGWLPRSGKNIDISMLRHAVSGGYNYVPTALDGAFNQALAFNLTTTGNSSTINLEDLARHDDIEIDGSLSRNDIYFGDDLHFDPVIWGSVAKHLRLYETLGSEENNYITVEIAAKARAARVAEAKRVNPSFNASKNEIMGSPGTTGLYLLTMWDDNYGAAPKAWVKAFFGMLIFFYLYNLNCADYWIEDERIPYLEGYQPPKVSRTLANITEMAKRVGAVEV